MPDDPIDRKHARMQRFERRPMAPPDIRVVRHLKDVAAQRGLDFERDVAPRLFSHPGELFVNDRYHVIRERVGPLWHLSIRPLDPSQPRLWNEFQQIKNELVGDENEGVELFPAESRLTDLADQYHLWVAADPAFRFPFGFEAE
jgi:hypothetical protein